MVFNYDDLMMISNSILTQHDYKTTHATYHSVDNVLAHHNLHQPNLIKLRLS